MFTGVNAEFIYRSAGNDYELKVAASDADYIRDRRYWSQFSRITGDAGESTMQVRPDSAERASALQTQLRKLDGQHIIDLRVNFRTAPSL